MKNFIIRNLNIYDLPQIIQARIAQENENGNGASNEYIKAYERLLRLLFDKNNIIGYGAFFNNDLISLGCFNLINLGHEKQIPYLCGVWTNPRYRGKGLANLINNKLFERLKLYKDRFEDFALLTLEGNEAALNLYKKLGYVVVDGEMSFLGDITFKDLYSVKTINKGIINETIYSKDTDILSISFSTDQLFAHPSNFNGIMTRIISLTPLKKDFNQNDLYECLCTFFSEHRFCKLNINSIIKNSDLLNADILKQWLLQFEFTDTKGHIKKILPTNKVMKKHLN